MQKKYKRAIIATILSAALVTAVLILAGLEQVSLDEYGLNYNHIMANYSDNNVYGSGLYLIGIANSFFKVNKNQQTLSYDHLTTFSTDFYALTAYLEVSYLFSFTTSDFASLSTFIETMGDDPSNILRPLIKN